MSATDEFSATVELPVRVRMRHGFRQPRNWLQLVRFGIVGVSGYLINLVVFAACVHLIGIDYRVAFVAAFVISVGNNFWWNRHWTFNARHEHPVFQGARFFTVSVAAQGIAYVILVALVSGTGIEKVLAQAIAVGCVTPLSFIGNKLWSFRA